MKWLNIICIVLFSSVLSTVFMFFADESCLPYKRKMEKMLRTIRSYQNNIEVSDVEVCYKGQTFNVGVKWVGSIYRYGYYAVYINGNHIMTWHVLCHTFTKSRLEEHHGDMKASEEYEIITAAYQYAKKANDEWWDKKLNKPSYFD